MRASSSGDGEADRRPVAALLRRGSVYTVATAIQLSVFLLVLPLVTRLLPSVEFAEVTAALVVVQLLTYVAAAGLPYAITLEWFDRRGGPPAARSLVLVTALVAAGVALLADRTGTRWAEVVFADLRYQGALRAGVWSVVPFAVVLAGQAVLRSADRAGRFVVVTLVATVGAQGGGLAAVAVGDRTAGTFMAGYLVVLAAAALLALVLLGIDASRIADGALLRRSFAVGLPTIAHAVALYVLVAGDRAVVEQELGLAELARYQVAYLVGALGLTLAGAVNNAWSPIIYGADDDRRWDVLVETEAVLVRLGGLVVAGLALGAPFALAVFAPASYDRSELVAVVAIVAATTLPYLDYLAHGHVLFVERKAWLLSWMTPAAAAANVTLNLVLVPAIGLRGSASATVVAYAILAGLASRARRRLVDRRRDRRALLEGRIVGIVGVAAGVVLPGEGAAALAARAAGLAGVLWLSWSLVRRSARLPEVAGPR